MTLYMFHDLAILMNENLVSRLDLIVPVPCHTTKVIAEQILGMTESVQAKVSG